ncbi:uncharacterized protein AMSG_01547 [Thecamonas trahens ATCC 50062]|uniref:Uncharacterized protein n=1 Tax=Thecamonas trahens ATCC 50062 TaxID=461836 RepID=A0A0L0DRQ8_THETB|nr:hypothetical protein AMSG_01547 [Thecamonas trahens ATCC 50062]KNC54696.1 hypothetical protein AMSG_01547 [Thecamonas trahens ATCC 50062]|eukprot:XP_013761598.1 hypothetical protein AMSG_01547 [Thecamonas trahens ATCC 50062]
MLTPASTSSRSPAPSLAERVLMRLGARLVSHPRYACLCLALVLATLFYFGANSSTRGFDGPPKRRQEIVSHTSASMPDSTDAGSTSSGTGSGTDKPDRAHGRKPERQHGGSHKRDIRYGPVAKCARAWARAHNDEMAAVNKMLEAEGVDGSQGCVRTMPASLVDSYTQDGKLGVDSWYKCQPFQGHTETVYTTQQIDDNLLRIALGKKLYYKYAALFMYKAAAAFPWAGKDVAIMGSQRPNFESICIYYNASTCTTIDYHKPISKDSRLQTMTIDEWDAAPRRFDAAISVSSFEHDGLGRYGDPLNPDGDLGAVAKMSCVLKPGGILYLSVPVAKDKIVWNMHRVYGRLRLPKLLAPFTLLDVIGDNQLKERLNGCDSGAHGDYQPIFVLRNAPQPHPYFNAERLDELFGASEPLLADDSAPQCSSTPTLRPT